MSTTPLMVNPLTGASLWYCLGTYAVVHTDHLGGQLKFYSARLELALLALNYVPSK